VQHEVLAVSLDTQAQMLKTHAAGLEKISSALKGARQK